MVYLASQSPRRRQLLRQLHRPFRVVRSSYQETMPRGRRPSLIVMRNALGKAQHASLPSKATGIVIGADTVLYFRGRVIGKPRTLRGAVRLVSSLSAHRHWVYTGVCLRDLSTGALRMGYEKTKVTFKPLTRGAIAQLFTRASPLDKAGGYALQESRGELIARIEGSRSNVIGLPMALLRRELRTLETRSVRRAVSDIGDGRNCC